MNFKIILCVTPETVSYQLVFKGYFHIEANEYSLRGSYMFIKALGNFKGSFAVAAAVRATKVAIFEL